MRVTRTLIQVFLFVSLSLNLCCRYSSNTEEWTVKVSVRWVTSIPAPAETK